MYIYTHTNTCTNMCTHEPNLEAAVVAFTSIVYVFAHV